ncbi:hypothetical protein [Crossiella cryophila]|uniref:Uncharacterized protein n=1 Tax=Crossiella cryophila TaxID=43355 RepID=A0A7W7CAD0_9PSEU|nr:hypothetical protein [Crossiella cryophila]MBB4677415.1 hypothetical protein [Crossiella cryophila]
MSEIPTEDELDRIEERARQAFAVAPLPWLDFLETRHGIGGCSFIRLDADSELDHELYVNIYQGSEKWPGRDARMDAILHYIASAAADVPRLVAEIRRLRAAAADHDTER